jgi:hypothetical protein
MTAPHAQPPHLITALQDLDTEAVPERRQPGHRFTVYVDGADPFEVRVTNRDRIAFEKAAAKHREWPAAQAAPNFAVTFLTWSAAKREQLTTLTFDQWQDALEDYDQVTEEPADPTR